MSTIVKLSYKASGGHICDISWYIEEIFTVFTGFYDKSALRCSRRMWFFDHAAIETAPMLPFSSTSANIANLLSCRCFRVSLQQHDDFGISGDLRGWNTSCCALTPMSAPLRFSTRCGLGRPVGRPVGTESCPKNEVSNGYLWLKIGCFAKPSTSINVVFRYLNNIIFWIQVGTPTLINKNVRSLRKFRTSGALGLWLRAEQNGLSEDQLCLKLKLQVGAEGQHCLTGYPLVNTHSYWKWWFYVIFHSYVTVYQRVCCVFPPFPHLMRTFN